MYKLANFLRCALVLWYLLVSTHAAYAIMDAMSSGREVALEGNFACAGHGCGCKTAQMCRTQCCCFPKKKNPAVVKRSCHSVANKKPGKSCHAKIKSETREEKKERVSYLNMINCQGKFPSQAGGAVKGLDQHMGSGFMSVCIQERAPVDILDGGRSMNTQIFERNSEKVPIL